MGQYLIGNETFTQDHPDLEAALARAYAAKTRPACLCHSEPGIPMYIAFVNGKYWLKRMPNSGRLHATGCLSWEMPEVFSGRSDLYGSGLTFEEDQVKLKRQFDLSRRGAPGPQPTSSATAEKTSVKSEGKKFTLRSLLHYLWAEAGLTQWDSSSRPRSWSYVYDVLSEAAANKAVKHGGLQDYLYVPPFWSIEKSGELQMNRPARFAAASNGDPKGAHKLLLLIGQLKDIKTQEGKDPTVQITHIPELSFLMEQKLHDRLMKHFGREWNLRTSAQTVKRNLIIAATFYLAPGGVPAIEEACLMCTTEHWFPIENIYEGNIIDDLVKTRRSFIRVLRYNRAKSAIMPTLLLTDHGSEPVAMYVLDPDNRTATSEDFEQAAKEAAGVENPKDGDSSDKGATNAPPREYWIWDLKTGSR